MKFALLGAWLGAVLVAVVIIAYGSSYEAQILSGNKHLHFDAMLTMIAVGAVVGFVLGGIVSAAGKAMRRPDDEVSL